jgi:predicted nucleic acid-binding protein
MFYIDTSVSVAYYCPEPLSEKAEAFLRARWHSAISTLTTAKVLNQANAKIKIFPLATGCSLRATAKLTTQPDDSIVIA